MILRIRSKIKIPSIKLIIKKNVSDFVIENIIKNRKSFKIGELFCLGIKVKK